MTYEQAKRIAKREWKWDEQLPLMDNIKRANKSADNLLKPKVVFRHSFLFKNIPVEETNTAILERLDNVELASGGFIHLPILIPPTFIQDKSYISRNSLADIATYDVAKNMLILDEEKFKKRFKNV